MRFKAYAWSGVDRDKGRERMVNAHYNFQFIPGLEVEFTRTDMAQDEISDWWPHKRDYRGSSFFILVSWLFWGFTLDFRFGDDARPEGD